MALYSLSGKILPLDGHCLVDLWMWANPLEEAAIREAKEETSLDVTLVEQFHAYSKPGRDPRFHTVTMVFIADGKGTLKGRDDARKAEIFTEETFPIR